MDKVYFGIIVFVVLCIIYKIYVSRHSVKPLFFTINKAEKNKNLYISEYKILNKIKLFNKEIIEEVANINNSSNIEWSDWPEKDLYNSDLTRTSWKIFPFLGFGKWVEKNCDKCPYITKFLKSVPNLKLAIISKLNPGMKLTPHRGWGKHSNNVLRCHYGLIVPKYCYISVSNTEHPPMFNSSSLKLKSYPENIIYNKNGIYEEIQFHKQFEWLIFDDSETHYAENLSDSERIVLILDIQRPDNIKKGTATKGDTKELLELVKYYKEL
jgi:beta-hydroxylase